MRGISNIAGHRNRSPSYLIGQTIQLFPWEYLCYAIDLRHQFHSFSPGYQLPIRVSHDAPCLSVTHKPHNPV